MKGPPFHKTVRGRLLLLAIGVVGLLPTVLAANGWPLDPPLSEASRGFPLLYIPDDPSFDVVVPLALYGQPLGQLHFGLNLEHIHASRRSLLLQEIGIAVVELILSPLILLLIGFRLTRRLTALTPAPVAEGEDDLGQMGAAFNTLPQAIADRVRELTAARDRSAASEPRLRIITDSARDAILMTDPRGAIRHWNPAAEKIFGYSADSAQRTALPADATV